MDRVMTSRGDPVSVVYFSERFPGSNASRLMAAVAWRGTPDRWNGRAPRRGLRAWLRRLRHRLWLRFGPFGMDLRLRGSRPRAGGGASFSPDGERVTYYDAGRHLVQVLNRAYALPPDGHTLVLLVDEGGRADAEPRVAVRTVPSPVLVAEPSAPGDAAFGQEDAMAATHAAWTAALRADAEVRAFLERGTDS